MRMSEQIDELAKALAAAQGELESASKNATNPHLKNRYADIAAVWEALRSVLPKHGLAVSQVMCDDTPEGMVCIESILMHQSGQWLASRCALPVPKRDPQGYGSAITYARRYSLSALVGVVSEEDDDGEGAKQRPTQQASRKDQPQRPPAKQSPQRQQQSPPADSRPPEPPPVDDEPQAQPPAQHVTLDEAKWQFTTSNSAEALKAAAKKLGIRQDNPDYDAILEAYTQRYEDLTGKRPGQNGDSAQSETSRTITDAQRKGIMAHFSKRNMAGADSRDKRLAEISSFFQRDVQSVNDLTFDEASDFLSAINANREEAA